MVADQIGEKNRQPINAMQINDVNTDYESPLTAMPFPPSLFTLRCPAESKPGPAPVSYGAVLMVPSEDMEAVLSMEETTPAFGEPVLEQGVNWSELLTLYRQAIHGESRDSNYEAWNRRTLAEFRDTANCHEVGYFHRLLTLRDQLLQQGLTFQEFYRHLKEEYKYTSTDRTLRRQIAHARLGLLLAAKGRIDKLPSQNVSAVIVAKLPRAVWIPFLDRHPIKEAGNETVKKNIFSFADYHRVPLRMQSPQDPVSHRPHLPTSPGPFAPEPQSNKVEGTETEVSAVPEPCANRRKVAKNNLAKQLAVELSGRVPAYHLAQPESLAKSIIEEIDATVTGVPKPGRHEKLDELASVLKQLDPNRCDALHQAAVRIIVGDALDSAIKKVRSLEKKGG